MNRFPTSIPGINSRRSPLKEMTARKLGSSDPASCTRKTLPTQARKIALAMVAFSALANVGVSHAAGRVFYDGFESGNTSLWSQDGFRNRCNAVPSASDGGTGPHSGKYMVRCNWNGAVAWNDPASYETLKLGSLGFSGGTELLIRFYLRVDNNAKDHPAHGPKIWRLAAANDMSFWAMNFAGGSASGAMYNSAGQQIGGTFWGGLSSLSNGQWHKYEIYIKQGTTNGIVRYWEDGQKMWEAVNVNTSQNGGVGSWAPFYMSSNWSGDATCCAHDASNYLYWDDFEIYSDTGSGASGSLADASVSSSTTVSGSGSTTTTTPSAPSVLRVQ